MLPLHHHGPNVIVLLSFSTPTYTVKMSKLSGVDKVYKYQNISTTTAVLFVELFSVYTVQYRHMLYLFQNIVIIAIHQLWGG